MNLERIDFFFKAIEIISIDKQQFKKNSIKTFKMYYGN